MEEIPGILPVLRYSASELSPQAGINVNIAPGREQSVWVEAIVMAKEFITMIVENFFDTDAFNRK